MRAQTAELLASMQSWPWFEHVGEPISDPGVTAVRTWERAIELASSDVWEHVELEFGGRFTEKLLITNPPRYQQWNHLVDELKALMEPLSPAWLRPIAVRPTPPAPFINQVRWDVLHIGMETEYSDICPESFYAGALAPWYRTGHFPCGWDGPKFNDRRRAAVPPHRLFVF